TGVQTCALPIWRRASDQREAEPLIRWIGFRKNQFNLRRLNLNESMQHFLAGVEAVFARGFRKGGQGSQGGAARAGFHQLGPIHGHAVLPVGTGAFLARDLWWSGVLRGAVEAS